MDKKIIKLSIFTLIVGLIIAVVGLVSVNGEMTLISDLYSNDGSYEDKVYLAEDKDIDEIDLQFNSRRIVFNSTDNDTIEVIYFDTERDNLEITQEYGKLNITNNYRPQRFFSSFGYTSLEKRTVVINLPKNVTYSVKVWSGNGDIILEDVSNIVSLNTFAVNANLKVVNVTNLYSLHSQTTNGNLLIKDTTINNIELISINGNLSTVNVSSVNVSAQTTNGNISIALAAEPELYKIDTHTINGRVRFNGLKLSNGIYQQLGIYNVVAKTTNGNIKITIK